MVNIQLHERFIQWYKDKTNIFTDKDLMDLQQLRFVIDVTEDNDFILTDVGLKYIINFYNN